MPRRHKLAGMEVPCIPKAELDALLHKARSGDKAAEDEAINRSLNLIWWAIRTHPYYPYFRTHEPDDLEVIGKIAFWDAIHSWKPELGAFSNWLKWRVWCALTDAMYKDPIIRPPTRDVLRTAKRDGSFTTSLNEPLYDDSGECALEHVPDPSDDLGRIIDRIAFLGQIDPLLAQLPTKDAELIRLWAGIDGGPPLSPTEIGMIYRVSRQSIHVKLKTALRRLRSLANEARLKGEFAC